MLSSKLRIIAFGSISFGIGSITGFVPNNNGAFISRHASGSSVSIAETSEAPRVATHLFMAKLWDRMQIEEDPEPMWYVLNCVAGLEIDLLRQCRQRCDHMEDVEKFVVPMITSTRSHGANRMVRETKVKYLGYVFAKLRLCPETYEAIQGLDLCRSWMGTVNYKGHKKLPPAPVALNEDEIENFGLEDVESQVPEEPEDDGIILDTDEEDTEAAEIEEHVQTVYKGLRVEDMVKVITKNKFQSEDGIVRRLKEGKILVRFFTYGTMYEEWLDPGDVRKLDSVEVLKGLGGPSQPVTQRDLESRTGGGRYGDDQRSYDSRRNLAGRMGDGPRNRREDRTAGRFRRDSDREDRRERDNWNWYQDNERRGRGGKHSDGEYDIRGSARDRNKDWTQSDVDSQWGRETQRKNRKEQRPRNQRQNKPQGADEDWSAFVTPAASTPSQKETDDFFSSLMSDLSNDLGADSSHSQETRAGDGEESSSDDDDFFASLMSEIDDTEKTAAPAPSGTSEDDFFASLENEIKSSASGEQKPQAPKPSANQEVNGFLSQLALDEGGASASSGEEDADDFFAGLEAELQEELSLSGGRDETAPTSDDDDDDGFFASLMSEIDDGEKTAALASSGTSVDDFFASLENEMQSSASGDQKSQAPAPSAEPAKETTPKSAPKSAPKGEPAADATTSSSEGVDLQKCTVTALKDMLRERGLKVSGKKAELIERLQMS